MKKVVACLAPALLLAAACGVPTNEETAAEAAVVAGQTVSALTSAAAVGGSAQSAQMGKDDGADPSAPQGAEACAMVSLTTGRLVVDYGTGCDVDGQTLAGAYAIYLTWLQGLAVGIDFTDFSVDGRTQNGNMELGVAQGRVAAHIDLEIVENQQRSDIELDGTLLVDQTDVNLDGNGRFADPVKETTFVAAGLHSKVGACYADAGTITLDMTGYPEAVVTFDANTPATGIATVTVGGVFSQPLQLPSIGKCQY